MSNNSFRLFHGTTAEAAMAIQQGGFVAWDEARIQAMVDEIAHRYAIDSSALAAEAAGTTYLGHLKRTNEKLVHFTGNWMTAWSYSSRSPEIRWELMLTAWSLLNDGTPARTDAELWARKALVGHGPTIVTIDVPFGDLAPHLPARGRQPAGLQEWTPHNLDLSRRDVALPSPVRTEWIVDVSPAPRLLTLPEVADLLGLDPGVVAARVRSGEVPKPTSGYISTHQEWSAEDIGPWLAKQGVIL